MSRIVPTSYKQGRLRRPGFNDWRGRSACLDMDPELFFPIGTSGPALLQIDEAKAVCRRCTVRDSCLQASFALGCSEGVWGGLTPDERKSLQRRTRRKARTKALKEAIADQVTEE